jgi:hypothetical protein
VRDDADLAIAERGICLDAIDQRRAARRRRKQTFDNHNLRSLTGNHIERPERLSIGEGLDLAEFGALLEDGKMLGRGNQYDGRGHGVSV